MKQWQKKGFVAFLLWPLSLLFIFVSHLRRWAYQGGLLSSWQAPVPLVFVGNVTVGGTGKSPIVLALAQELKSRGWQPGIVSRAYGVKLSSPQLLDKHSTSEQVGDEPLMLFSALKPYQIPVAVFPKRSDAIRTLLQNHPECNVILCDDGLQHYALQRKPAYAGGHDIELMVFDSRGAGNQLRMPAGPLRESVARPVDAIIWNLPDANQANPVLRENKAPAYAVHLQLEDAYALSDPTQKLNIKALVEKQNAGDVFLAAAGIGSPERFFNALIAAGFSSEHLQTLALPDHYSYKESPFPVKLANKDSPAIESLAAKIILITEKDAVKCQHLHDKRIWVVPARVQLPESLLNVIETGIRKK